MAFFVFDKDNNFVYSSLAKIDQVEEGCTIKQGPNYLLTQKVSISPEGEVVSYIYTDKELADIALAKSKQERTKSVSKITVEIDGMVFDGDEISQERMSRTVVAAAAAGEPGDATTTWVLHDNTIAQPTISQLARALRAAGEEQTKLWTVPYEDKVDESTESSEAVAA